MMVWHKGDPRKYSFCKSVADSHKHLFFECQYSEKVSKKMQSKSTLELRTFNLQNMVENLSVKALGNVANFGRAPHLLVNGCYKLHDDAFFYLYSALWLLVERSMVDNELGNVVISLWFMVYGLW
nr:hypothetical protein [Tanacetum cinerariifolium]